MELAERVRASLWRCARLGGKWAQIAGADPTLPAHGHIHGPGVRGPFYFWTVMLPPPVACMLQASMSSEALGALS